MTKCEALSNHRKYLLHVMCTHELHDMTIGVAQKFTLKTSLFKTFPADKQPSFTNT
jgi:hypothetical protein